MSNADIFANYLKENDMDFFERDTAEDGSEFFRCKQTIKNGGNVGLLVCFSKDDSLVDLRIFDVAVVEDPLKKDALRKLLNELNTFYRFAKFVENDGEVIVGYAFDIEGSRMDAGLICEQLISLYHSASDSYPKFMKLLWN